MNNVESTMFGKLLTYVTGPRIIYLLPKAASYSWRCVIADLNFPPTVLYTEAYLDFVSAVVTSYYDVAVRNLHWSIIIPQEFTIANRRLPNTLFSDLRTTYQEWRLKNISNCSFVAYKHKVRSEAKTFFV
jgi:hypothetical protein